MVKVWTPEMAQFLEKNAKGKGYQELTDLLNKAFYLSLTRQQVKARMNHKKIKTGKQPKNSTKYYEVGYEMKINGQVYVKLSDEKGRKGFMYSGTWKQKHRIVWEQAHGPIPRGYNIIFLDGNRANFALDNLAMITREEQIQLNSKGLISDDPELTKTGIAIVRHNIVIHKKLRQVLGEKGHNDFYRERYNEKRRIKNKIEGYGV